MSDKRPDVEASEDLARVCFELGAQTRLPKMAVMAYVQATLAQCAVQALVDILKRRNLLSDAELERCLAEAYTTRKRQIAETVMLNPIAPTVRPGGLLNG